MAAETIDRRTGPADLGRLRHWVFVATNRWLVAGALGGLVFGGIVLGGSVGAVDFRNLVSQADVTRRLFQALILNLITAVTLVVTINQIVLSQEVAATSEQRDRLEEALNFRGDVAERIEPPVSPTAPAALFAELLRAVGTHAEAMQRAIPAGASDACQEDVHALGEQLVDRVAPRIDALSEAEWATFEVLGEALRFDNSSALYEARRLAGRYDEEFSPGLAAAHAGLTETLGHYALAREYFKSLYIQRELIDLSRGMIVTAVPGLLATLLGLLFLDATSFPGSILGIETLLLVVAAATTLAVLPFLLLLAYVLRLGMVTEFNLAVGPFEVD